MASASQVPSTLAWDGKPEAIPNIPRQQTSTLSLNQNKEYIQLKMVTARPDTHWQQLLQEIVEDVRNGRMEGPFIAPPDWQTKTIAAAQYIDMCTLQEGPSCHVPTSVAFSIEQIGSDGQPKIRRGEDWKRSKRNTTVSATDTPNAHRPDTFTAVAQWLHQHNHQAQIWGPDQEAAYRQLAVADPTETYVLLRVPHGWTLWRHTCLLFGSAGSVWAYTRTADMLAWITRATLLVPTLHYVDDFAALEANTTIQSGFEATHSTLQTMGFRFKPTKMQPPHHSQRIQGLWMTATEDSFVLQPCPKRTGRITQQILQCLQSDTLSGEHAAKLAGKLQFLQEAVLGQSIRACLYPLYKHAAASAHQSSRTKLSPGTRDALATILQLRDVQF